VTRLNLHDTGMRPKSVEYDSLEAAIQALQQGLHPNYTYAAITTDGRTTHMAKREVGETTWMVKERP
jgi:hypothetical protein